MNVGAVQQHFHNLVSLVQQADAAKKVVDELSLIATGFEPFKDYKLEQFVEFLKKAEEYNRTGVLPVVPVKVKKPPRVPRVPKPPKPQAAEVIQRVVTLYQNILTPTITSEYIDAELALVDTLKGPDLQALAVQLEIGEKVKKLKVKEKSAAIKQMVRDRRGMFERADF